MLTPEELKAIREYAAGVPYVWPETILRLLDRIAELEGMVPRWVPVAERLPEETGRYICACLDRDEGLTDVQEKPYYHGQFRPESFQDVTHWQPLPPPPTKETGHE